MEKRDSALKKICRLDASCVGQTITVGGWVRSVRAQKNLSFIDLTDGSTLAGLQLVAGEISPEVTTGASLRARGTLVKSPGDKQAFELQVQSLEIVGPAPPEEYPLQKKRHSFEFLRTIAHLRPRTNTQGVVLRIRNALAFATHQFFQERDFLYVQTPIITTSDCEGGGEQFLVTTLNLNKIPRHSDGAVDFTQDFFHKPAYLTVSGQLNGEALACAVSDIYTFGPTFRAENSNTSRHLAEFWMIEPEMAFASLQDNMACAEAYIHYVVRAVLDRCHDDLALLDAFIEKGLVQRLEAVVRAPFAHLTYTQAIEILKNSKQPFVYPVEWGVDLQSEHERFLAEDYCKRPVILTDYPAKIKAFYMRANDDDKTVAAMDILVPKIGELVGGSAREDRLPLLEKKMTDLGLPVADYWWYLQLRRFGSVPHAGFGVGFERLVQFATGMENIRDVIPFPRFPGHADF
jgi:asparaginyl-tRNA synthetase